MLVGAAILPTAPLLVPGASPAVPEGVARVCDAVDEAVERLPEYDLAVLLAGDERGGVHLHAEATLSGIGRPDIATTLSGADGVAERVAEATGLPLVGAPPLPLDLAVLALLLGGSPAVVPVAVPRDWSFERLVAAGRALLETAGDRRVAALAAGDLAAGLTERSPLHRVDGAGDFDAAVVEAVAAGRLDRLAGLGPAQALRVGARGWAALAALHGALAAARLRVARRLYSAPQGVGYLVADSA